MSAFLFFATRLSDGSAPPASRCRGPPTAHRGLPSILAGHGGPEKTPALDHEVDRAVNPCEWGETVADTNPTSNRSVTAGTRRIIRRRARRERARRCSAVARPWWRPAPRARRGPWPRRRAVTRGA